MDVTVEDAQAASAWLDQMGDAARRHGIRIQYCMATSRAALHSVTVPVVTQVCLCNSTLTRCKNSFIFKGGKVSFINYFMCLCYSHFNLFYKMFKQRY